MPKTRFKWSKGDDLYLQDNLCKLQVIEKHIFVPRIINSFYISAFGDETLSGWMHGGYHNGFL